MKKFFLAIVTLCLSLTTSAQILVGDMDGDNKLTTNDAELSASTVLGKTPVKYIDGKVIDNSAIVGTWWKSKTENVTFAEDSTTTYVSGYTYQYLPDQNAIFLFNSSHQAVDVLDARMIEGGDTLVLQHGEDGTSEKYVKGRPYIYHVSEITLSSSALTLMTGCKQTLSATILPDNADDKTLSWSSSDETVAIVTNGIVTGKSAGSATITATANDGTGVTAQCAVNVVQSVTGITLSRTVMDMLIGTESTLTATVTPIDAFDTSVSWISSNEKVATVADGVIKAISKGVANITCVANDESGIKSTCLVVVLNSIEEHEYVDLGLSVNPHCSF